MDRQTLGPYVLLEEIGAGGMGNVYLGRHRETSELVAVKVLPATLAREEGFVMRFTREAEALRTLTNPHVVRLLDSGVDNETYYFAMEYVAGENLADRLKRDHRLPWEQAFDFATQLCTALKAAHDAGIIHRDLKPSNVLITKEGQIKLTDFGVAQLFAAERLTITGGVIGTAEYMSPEQAQGQRATKRSDLYSLGAVLYAMLTGRPPFTGPTAVDVMHKQRYAQFDKPSRYIPELPPAVDLIMADLLAKSPDERPPDAFVVSRRLQDVIRKVQAVHSDDPTPPATAYAKPSPDAGPGAATFMRDLVRAEVVRSAEPSLPQRILNNTFVLLSLLVGLIAFVWWMAMPRHTPESQLAEAQRILSQPAGPEWIRARDELLAPLISDEALTPLSKEQRQQRTTVVEPLLKEIRVYELEQSLISPRRRERKSTAPSEPVRHLAEIRRIWNQGDLTAAQAKLEALIVILRQENASTPEAGLAERWREQINEDLQQTVSQRREYVRGLLKQAQDIATRDDRAARQLLESIVTLYALDSSLSNEVDEARKSLNTMSQPAATP